MLLSDVSAKKFGDSPIRLENTLSYLRRGKGYLPLQAFGEGTPLTVIADIVIGLRSVPRNESYISARSGHPAIRVYALYGRNKYIAVILASIIFTGLNYPILLVWYQVRCRGMSFLWSLRRPRTYSNRHLTFNIYCPTTCQWVFLVFCVFYPPLNLLLCCSMTSIAVNRLTLSLRAFNAPNEVDNSRATACQLLSLGGQI